MTNRYMNDVEIIKYRLECLKMSYDINSKIGNLKNSYDTEEEINKDLHDIFLLADMNFQYVVNGTNPLEEYNSENEPV